MEDSDLRRLFASYTPSFTPSEQYMVGIERKLEAIDSVKHYAEDRRRDSRRLICVTFVAGMIMGIGVVSYLLMNPLRVSLFLQSLSVDYGLFVEDSSVKMLLATGVGVLVICGAVAAYVLHPRFGNEGSNY